MKAISLVLKYNFFFTDNLTDTKQLRGGVIFLNEIPMTVTTKIHRRKLKELVLTMDKE